MKVICTLKNSPSPHIHDKATEFPQSSAFNQRKFIKSAKEPRFPPWGKLDSSTHDLSDGLSSISILPKIRLETPHIMERLPIPGADYH